MSTRWYPAEVTAAVRVGVAGDTDDHAVVEHRTAGVSEAGSAGTARVLVVAVGLQDLRGELLSGHHHEAADQREGHRLRLQRTRSPGLVVAALPGEDRFYFRLRLHVFEECDDSERVNAAL
jgi:hypothetical protein